MSQDAPGTFWDTLCDTLWDTSRVKTRASRHFYPAPSKPVCYLIYGLGVL
jgi:hypothetical protein